MGDGEAERAGTEDGPLVKIRNCQRYSQPGALHIIGANRSVLYHGDDVEVAPVAKDDEQDEFFKVTLNDVKNRYLDLQTKRNRLEDAPLSTQNARELEKAAAISRQLEEYPETIVKIRFPDRYVLQGVLKTGDPILSMYQWVQTLLSNPEMHFELFTTPPKKLLNKELKLHEEYLVGTAVVYFGHNDPEESESQGILKPEIYSQVSAPDAAFEYIQKEIRRKNIKRLDDNSASTNGTSATATAGSSSSSQSNLNPSPAPSGHHISRGPRTAAYGIPKWFKLGK